MGVRFPIRRAVTKQRNNARPWDPRTIDVQAVHTRGVRYMNVNRVANVIKKIPKL